MYICIDDVFLVLDATTESIVQSITSSVSDEIGEKGGKFEFQSSDVCLIVPEGAVPPATSFSLKSYVDPRVMPPVASKDEVILSPAFQLSSSLPQGVFKKPLQLSLPPEVPLKASGRDNGWLLQLKRSKSCDGLPDEWHTVLELNTKTREVVSHSPFVQYDLESGTVCLNQFSWLSWIGTALQTLGSRLNSCSLREIDYAVFGKQIQRYKWLIAAHIIHRSKAVYISLVRKLKEEGYVELYYPNTDCIGLDGEVSFRVQCMAPWQMQQGKPEFHIKAYRVWGSGQQSSCYHQFTVEDSTCLADTLEFTIEASFQAKGARDAGDPLPLIISHPLSQSRTPTAVGSEGIVPYTLL